MNKISLRRIYLYFFSALGLILVVIAGIQVVNLGLKMTIFREADQYIAYPGDFAGPKVEGQNQPSEEELAEFEEKQRTAQRQRSMSDAIAFAVVGFPLYLYHWRQVKKLNDEKD